jgi:hypothetical protein
MIDGTEPRGCGELDLAALYHKVQKRDAYSTLQLDDLARQRCLLFDDLKRAQDLRCFASCLANCLRTSIFSVEAIGNLPFIAFDPLSVFDRILEIPEISNVRGDIGRFIQIIYRFSLQLPELLAAISLSVFVGPQVFSFLSPGIHITFIVWALLVCRTQGSLPSIFWSGFPRRFPT